MNNFVFWKTVNKIEEVVFRVGRLHRLKYVCRDEISLLFVNFIHLHYLCPAKIGNYAAGEAEEGDAEACSFEFGDL